MSAFTVWAWMPLRPGLGSVKRRCTAAGPAKRGLLVSILDEVSGDPLDRLPRSGSLRGDLVTLLTAVAEVLAGPTGVVSRAILGALDSEPVLADAYRRGAIAE